LITLAVIFKVNLVEFRSVRWGLLASVCGSVCSRFLRSRFFEPLRSGTERTFAEQTLEENETQLVRTFATLAQGRTSTANVRNVRTKERNTKTQVYVSHTEHMNKINYI
jgi:hypothetical protein